MRIVILADPLDNQQAGIHHYTRNLVTHLAEKDTQREYYLIRRKIDDIFPEDRQIIVKSYKFPGYAAYRMFILIPWKLRKLKADVVVEPAHFGPFNLPAKMKRVSVIHDLTPLLFPHLHRFHSQLLQRIFLKGILTRASLIITNSNSTTRDVETRFPGTKDKVCRIYLGRDESIANTEDISSVERFSGGKPYFLTASTIEPRKNLNNLLEAFAIFKEKSGKDHKLLIVGGRGWKNETFFRELKSHPYRDDIILCGYVSRDELSGLYSHAQAFAFPSLYEGFGLPVVEALSCGTPCLLSNTSSLPEVGGDAALYSDPLDAGELAANMLSIASDKALREDLAGKTRQQAEKFSWEEYVDKFHGEIKRMIE